MSTNHTENYNLSQWEESDAVLRTDFNEDNAKLDAALAGQAKTLEKLTKHLNCWVQKYTYTGFGTEYYTVIFNGQPLIVHIVGQNVWVCLTNNSPKAFAWNNKSKSYELVDVDWSMNGAIITSPSKSPVTGCNEKGETYYVTALVQEMVFPG